MGMQEPAQRGIPGADTPDLPAADAESEMDRAPSWPTAGSRPPDARPPGQPPTDSPPPGPLTDPLQPAEPSADAGLSSAPPADDELPTDPRPLDEPSANARPSNARTQEPPAEAWPSNAQPAHDQLPKVPQPLDEPSANAWPSDAQPADDELPTDPRPLDGSAAGSWPSDTQLAVDSRHADPQLPAPATGQPTADAGPTQTEPADPWAAGTHQPAHRSADDWPVEASAPGQPAADAEAPAGFWLSEATVLDEPTDTWSVDAETLDAILTSTWPTDPAAADATPTDARPAEPELLDGPAEAFWPWSDDEIDDLPAAFEPWYAPESDAPSIGSSSLDADEPGELAPASQPSDGPESGGPSAGTWSLDMWEPDEPSTWSGPDQPTAGSKPPDNPAPGSRPVAAAESAAPPPAAVLARAQLRGWPLARPRGAISLPPDWPSPDAPRPEDEPTLPIEDLVEMRRTAPDEPTDELPIIGRADGSEPPAPGRRWLVGAGVTAALLVLVGGTAVARGRSNDESAGYRAGAPAVSSTTAPPAAADIAPGTSPSDSSVPSDAAIPSDSAIPSSSAIPSTDDPAHTATAPLDGRTEAGFDLVEGVDAVVLRTADLGGDLYRVVTPSATPRVTDSGGRIQLALENGASTAVEVTLSSTVRWDLRVGGGANLSTIDLSGARLAAVDLAGNASRINLLLPRPDGTLTVRMSGGVNQFFVHTVGEVPVRVRLGSGAGQVVLDGTSHLGVAAGALFTPDRWDETVDRIDVNAVAGMAALTIGP